MTQTFSRPKNSLHLSAVFIEVILIYNAILWESESDKAFSYDNTMEGAHSTWRLCAPTHFLNFLAAPKQLMLSPSLCVGVVRLGVSVVNRVWAACGRSRRRRSAK